jgi:hypothetical protein
VTRELLQQALDALNRVDAVERGMVTTKTHHYAAREGTTAAIAALRAELAKPEQKPFFQFRECEDSQAGQPAPFKPLGTVYRWTALKNGKLVYQYGEDGYPQLFAKTAVKLPEEPEPSQEPLTDAEIEDCMKTAYATLGKSRNLEHVFARTIEAAHGIGGKA